MSRYPLLSVRKDAQRNTMKLNVIDACRNRGLRSEEYSDGLRRHRHWRR